MFNSTPIIAVKGQPQADLLALDSGYNNIFHITGGLRIFTLKPPLIEKKVGTQKFYYLDLIKNPFKNHVPTPIILRDYATM